MNDLVNSNKQAVSPLQIRFGSEGYDIVDSYLIDDLLPENSLVCLYGPSGTYKSFLAQSWACHIATGKSWDQRNVEQSATLYIAAEGGRSIATRIKCWEKVKADGAFTDYLAHYDGVITMGDQAQIDFVVNIASEVEVRTGYNLKLIVIDTLARSFGSGDENSAKDMGTFISGCDQVREKTGATVLIVHHTGKEMTKGPRGSSALYAALDAAYLVSTDNCKDGFILSCTKMKDGPLPDDRHYRLEESEVCTNTNGKRITSLVVDDSGTSPGTFSATDRLTDNHSTVMESLRSLGGEQCSIPIARLREHLRNTGVDTNHLSRWLTALQKAGMVRIEHEHIVLTSQS